MNPLYVNDYAIYYNPVTGKSCSQSESSSTMGKNDGCMKWWVYSENSDGTVNMLLDHNTVVLCYWTDALSTSKTTNGPIEALLALYKTTDSWIGVPERTDSYTVNQQYAKYTINYSGHRARLIESGEIAKIT